MGNYGLYVHSIIQLRQICEFKAATSITDAYAYVITQHVSPKVKSHKQHKC